MVSYHMFAETEQSAVQSLLDKYFDSTNDKYMTHQITEQNCKIIIGCSELWIIPNLNGSHPDYDAQAMISIAVYSAKGKDMDKIPANAQQRFADFWNELKRPVAFKISGKEDENDKELTLEDFF